MQIGEALSIQAVRLLPWDLGCSLDSAMASEFQRVGSRIQGWEPIIERSSDEGEVLWLRHDSALLSAEIHVYEDGICLLEVLETPISYDSYLDFDPEVLAEKKREAAARLLGRTHESSAEIQRVVDALRLVAKPRAVRTSANCDWERGGFSYLFSFHLIVMQSGAHLDDVRRKASRLLHPIRPMKGGDAQSLAAFDLTRGLENVVAETQSIELGHGLLLQSTWATLCAIGRMTDVEKRKIRLFERFIQRHWFYCYVAGHHLKSLISDLRRSVPTAGLAAMGEIAADAQLVAIRLRDIRSTMATQAELDAYEDLVRTSRLDQAAAQLDALVHVFLSRLSNYIEQRRLASTRTIEATVVILAIVSATADFTTITKDESARSTQLNFLVVIVCMLVLAFVLTRGIRRRWRQSGKVPLLHREIRDIWRVAIGRDGRGSGDC